MTAGGAIRTASKLLLSKPSRHGPDPAQEVIWTCRPYFANIPYSIATKKGISSVTGSEPTRMVCNPVLELACAVTVVVCTVPEGLSQPAAAKPAKITRRTIRIAEA